MPKGTRDFTSEGIERRSTGISGLDYQLGGGFPAGTSIVVFGNPLTGSDRMAKQFWKSDGNQSTYLMIDSILEEGMADAHGKPIKDILPLLEGDRIVIDSLSSLIINEGIDSVINFMTEEIDEIKSKKGNILFILYEGLHTPLEEIRVQRAADIFISLREEFHQNEIERKLIVHKIPSMDVPSRLYPFLIRDIGLELSTTARVV